jgi:hypothetical protein
MCVINLWSSDQGALILPLLFEEKAVASGLDTPSRRHGPNRNAAARIIGGIIR